jgi:hypothetical protein
MKFLANENFLLKCKKVYGQGSRFGKVVMVMGR